MANNTIDDYIMEPRLIDTLDFVFFGIEGSLLPWTTKARKIAKFFQICKHSDKPIFAIGAGMQFLVYY